MPGIGMHLCRGSILLWRMHGNNGPARWGWFAVISSQEKGLSPDPESLRTEVTLKVHRLHDDPWDRDRFNPQHRCHTVEIACFPLASCNSSVLPDRNTIYCNLL